MKKTKATPPTIAKHAAELLKLTRDRLARGDYWMDVHNAVFGIGGKAGEFFKDEAERTAFSKTPEFKQLTDMLDERAATQGYAREGKKARRLGRVNGNLSVRLPRAIHAALLAEAEAEGVSLNQLCLAKLATQLRAVI